VTGFNQVRSETAITATSNLTVLSAVLNQLQSAVAFFQKNPVDIKAKVIHVRDFKNFLNRVINEGDIVTGKYEYNILTKNTNQHSTAGDCQHNQKPY
jgi:hypothetical protein